MPRSDAVTATRAADVSRPTLSLAGVTKRFGAVTAVDRLDLDVPTGSLTALLGPSGCGKTTALRLIAGLEAPDVGTIRVHDAVVAGDGVFLAPERRRVGLVFQDHALFPHLTVAQNVAYGLVGMGAGPARRRVAEMLALVGLERHGDRLPSQLSGGQQQRVALARALAPRPAVLLLDEPFSNLDAALRASVREEVRSILDVTETTAVFVTHDQTEALSLADRVAVMDRGRLHQVAPPHELYARPATRFVAEFVGDALALPARRAGRFFVDGPLGRLETLREVPHGEIVAMVRPEEVVLRADPEGPGLVRGITYYGHDQVVSVAMDDVVVDARLGPAQQFGVGERVRVAVPGPVAAFPARHAAPVDEGPEATPTD